MSRTDNIEKEIVKIISTVTLIPEEELINHYENTVYDIGISSMLLIDIAAKIEQKYRVNIPNEIINPSQKIKVLINKLIDIINNGIN